MIPTNKMWLDVFWIIKINNFVALRLWRLGARDILELPLLADKIKTMAVSCGPFHWLWVIFAGAPHSGIWIFFPA